MVTEDLVSVRKFVDSDFDLSVRSCDAVLVNHETGPATGYDGTRINLNFNELENVKGISPYELPTLALNMGLSNKHKSRWGYFGDSLADLLAPDEDIKDAWGRRLTLVFCDGEGGRPEPKPIWNRDADPAEHPDKMVPTSVWIVTEIEGGGTSSKEAKGSSGADASTWAEENLIGKTRAEFNKWAFADKEVRKDTKLQRSIADKSFINTLINLKKVVEDGDGVFQQPE